VALRYDEVVQLGGVTLLVQRALAPPPPAYQLPPQPANLEALAAAQMSAAMQRLYQVVERVATGNISVLVLGETGVGKELLAEAIHRRSARAAGPLVRLNCSALSETLLESELFGYEKGAFTGALASKPGLLESADGGTVFLDEVGELSLSTQVKLLRVIESREVMRVGALRPRPIDVRFVAATHRDLEVRIDENAFREDLYFRLAGITVRIPPLRERVDEIETLAKYFAARFAMDLGRPCPRFAPDALARLLGHTWPGNIRELRNCIERAVLLCQEDRIGADEIVLAPRRTRVRGEPTSAEPPALPAQAGSRALDREKIVSALARAAGNQKVAAQLLGVSRRTLLNKLDRFGIDRPRKRRDE
jgi:DNA-binding NtrC family response regulator